MTDDDFKVTLTTAVGREIDVTDQFRRMVSRDDADIELSKVTGAAVALAENCVGADGDTADHYASAARHLAEAAAVLKRIEAGGL